MGKHLQRKHSGIQFEDNHPGCMWGILHILDSDNWHNVKKLLPHRRHGGRRHARCYENPKLSLNGHDTGAGQEIRNDEADYFFVDQSTKTSPANRRSGKARIKALIAKEMSKEEGHKCQVSRFPARSRLQRTDSIHHLELSDYFLPEKNSDWRHPIIFLPSFADASATKSQYRSLLKAPKKLVRCNNKCNMSGTMNGVDYLGQNQCAEKHNLLPENLDKERETLVNQKLMDTNHLDSDVSHPQFENYVDILEIFKINKELFQKMLQESGVRNVKHSHSLPKRVRLTKSGSFPVAEKLRGRNFSPGKLKHKQNEIWSFPKGGRLLAGTQASKLVESNSTEDLNAKSIPLMDDDSAGSVLKQVKRCSSLGSPEGSNDQKSSQEIIHHFKDIKQKIEHTIKENKRESNHTSLDALRQKFPHECGFSTDGKEIAETWKEGILGGDERDGPKSGYKTNGSVYDLDNGRLHQVRRTSSLNESLDRYVQLFEGSFRREAKLHLSRSLKLTKEVKVSSGEHGPKSFRRILSVPDLGSYSSLQNEGSRDIFCSEMPVRTVVDSSINVESDDDYGEPEPVDLPINTEKCVPADTVLETECQINMLERSDTIPIIGCQFGLTVPINDEGIGIIGELSENMVVMMGESHSHPEQGISFTKNTHNELAQPSPVSDPETCFPNDITCPAEFQISEGSELKPSCVHFDQPTPSVNIQNRSSTDSLSGSWSRGNSENVEKANKTSDNQFLHSELDKKNDANFSYVRDVLEQSGFIRNEFFETWHSLDQPLDPSVIEEVDACLPNESESSGQEVDDSCDHQLLFDLVNEALLEIYERSCTHCPRALSSSCHIRPMPMGYRVVEEVWASINWYLSSRQELDESFNYVIARDLAKGDGWMNLQVETECVALELEDIIFNELLDEVICS